MKRKYSIIIMSLLLLAGCGKAQMQEMPVAEVAPSATATVTPSPSPTMEPTIAPVITVTLAPTFTPSATPVLTVTPSPVPTATPVPTASVAPTSTPMPTKAPTPALKTPEGQLTVRGLTEAITDYGTFIGGMGMSGADYKAAMEKEWTLVADTGKYEECEVNIETEYHYEDLVRIWENLNNIEGVSLYEIGRTVENRPMYLLDINQTTVENPKIVVLTGNTHARETAGSVFITKQLNDLFHNENTKEYLKCVRILAVPCVNPDGRDGVAFDTDNWSYGSGTLWKANANGVDLNRNFPGLSWGQIKHGFERVSNWSDSPKKIYFPGYSAGSEPETRALMKVLDYAIIKEQADILIDYHQQGRIQYAGKPWQTNEQQKRCSDLALEISRFLANGKTYHREPEARSYGLRGEGSTLTDYACSLAVGAKFSDKYGFLVYTDGVNEYPLVFGKRVGKEGNPKFATTTLEIGKGTAYLGYGAATRKNLAKEYSTYNFDGLLSTVFEYVTKDAEFIVKTPQPEETAPFKVLDQKKFPTGCESVSAVMVLNHYGYDISVDTFVDKYLAKISSQEEFYKDKKNADKYVFDYYFVGDPRKESGSACNAPVIASAVETYLKNIGETELALKNLTGQSLDAVIKVANSGTPVLLWVSGELRGPSRTYELVGRNVYTNRHCVVLLEGDKDNITVADPMIGRIRVWDKKKAEEQFNLYGKQALCLQ